MSTSVEVIDRLDGTPRMTGRQKLVLVVLLGTQFMLAVDFSILNVALPAIGDGLGFSLSNLQWVVTAFALPAAGFTLLFGRLADLIGRKRLFLIGVALLLIASLLGGVADTPALLLIARVGQGMATAIATPAALSLLTTSFEEGPLRAKALGLNGALLPAGFTTGALLGGVLTDALSWRWAFLLNVPIAAVIFVATLAYITESRHPEHTRLDVPGAVTVTGGLLALVYGITTAGHQGWGDPSALGALALSAVLLVAFYFIELRSSHPLVPLRVLAKPTVKWGNFGGFVILSAGSAIIFLLTIYLQQVLGYSAMVTGLVFGGPGLAAVVAGIVSPRFIGKLGAHASLAISLVAQGVAFAALLLLGENKSGVVLVLVATTVGLFAHIYGIVSYIVTATSGLPNEEQGLATGLTTMSQQVALAMGIPIFSAIATAGAVGSTAADAVLGGIRLSILVNVVITLVAAVVVWTFLRTEKNAA